MLLLAQPETVTDIWKPLALWINRMLWAWSPWHLRYSLEQGKWPGRRRRLQVGVALRRECIPILHERDHYYKYLDREAAHEMAHALMKEGVVGYRAYEDPYTLNEHHIYTLDVVYPKESRHDTA